MAADGATADPRIAQRLLAALGDAQSIVNVGAGQGAYEPEGRAVVAVEPDEALRAARPEGSAPSVSADPAKLPFEDDSFDAAMACITSTPWRDQATGIAEMRRVARGPVVILTLDMPHHVGWQRDYLAPLMELGRRRFMTPAEIAPMLGRRTRIDALRTPADCAGLFIDAFWVRPEAFLDPDVRAAQPLWAELEPGVKEQIVARLRADLESGAWEAQHGHLRAHADYDGALRLIVDDPGAAPSVPRRI